VCLKECVREFIHSISLYVYMYSQYVNELVCMYNSNYMNMYIFL
jgi:hypothetical protein